MKLDIKQKEKLVELNDKVKESAQEYSKILSEFNYEYNENLNEVLEQFGSDVFDEMMKNNSSLLMRAKGVVDRILFKNEIIKEQKLNRNERISDAFYEHKLDLDAIRKYIPSYIIGNEYTLQFYSFKESKLESLLNDMIDTYDLWEELMKIIQPNQRMYKGQLGNEFRHPKWNVPEGCEDLLYQEGNQFVKSGKAKISLNLYDSIDVNKSDWVKLVEEIKI